MKRNLFILTLSFLITSYYNFAQQVERLNIEFTNPLLIIDNYVWIGHNQGLFQYSLNDDSFKKFSYLNKTLGKIKQLYNYKEWLFSICDSGLLAIQLRLNDMLFFDEANGIPSQNITGIIGLDDYIYITTDKGMARFDLLIEQWEIIDETKGLISNDVRDILVLDKKIWIATDYGFTEYDPDFEKWRNFPLSSDDKASISLLFLFDNDIWAVNNKGLIRFNPRLETQQEFNYNYLSPEYLIDIYLEEDKIWAVTFFGLFYYDRTQQWKEFEGNNYLKRQYVVVNGCVNQQQIWIATEQNVLVWDRTQKSWDILDYSRGLSQANYAFIFSEGGLSFLISEHIIDYKRNAADSWRKYRIPKTKEKDAGNFFKNLFDNEEGAFIDLWGYNLAFQGSRIMYYLDLNKMFDGGDFSPIETKSKLSLDYKSQLELGNSRRITAYYNNIDYSETMYGVRFRGNDSDLVRELNWGDGRLESQSNPFLQPMNTFGAGFWLQAGDKTPRFKRSLFTLKANTGEIRTKKTYQSYLMPTDSYKQEIKDIDYLKNQFYSLPDAQANITPSNIEIYIDDMNSRNNTANTIYSKIAGVEGYFDLKKPVEDYYYYEKAKAIRFVKPIAKNWIVVAKYIINGEAKEAILQSDTNTRAKKNIYYFGIQKILPYSFSLKIRDSLSFYYPLSLFGLSKPTENIIETDWIDYELGLLIFPDEKPFPKVVYDSNAISVFTLNIECKTELSLIQLAYTNLVRGSETLLLDGTPAIQGNDYVIDYTNGTLIFVREGALNPDTRIEIEYEYYDNTNGKILLTDLNFSPSDNFYLQTLAQKTTKDENILLSLFGEVREKIADFDVRINPGIAYQTIDKSFSSAIFQGFISNEWLRFQAEYNLYSDNYTNTYIPQAIFGKIKNSSKLNAVIDISKGLRISGNWNKAEGFSDSLGTTPKDEQLSASFLFNKENYPGWKLNFTQNSSILSDTSILKSYIQSQIEWELPKDIVAFILVRNIKIENFFRLGSQSFENKNIKNKLNFINVNGRINVQIAEQLQSSLFYRSNNLTDAYGKISTPLLRSERLIFDISQERWRLLQMNFRLENNLSQNGHQDSTFRDVNLRQFMQLNIRFSPGQLIEVLSPLFFEFNVNKNTYANKFTDIDVGNLLWNNFASIENTTNLLDNFNYYIKNEIRPNSDILIFSLFEWNSNKIKTGESENEQKLWRITEKADFRIGYLTHLILQYKQSSQDFSFNRINTSYEPSVWIEHRWSPDFQNIFNLIYRKQDFQNGNERQNLNSYEAGINLILRLNHFLSVRYIEIRQDFRGIFNNLPKFDGAYNNLLLTSSSSLDFYPLNSIIFRLRFDITKFYDFQYDTSNYLLLAFNLKISMKF